MIREIKSKEEFDEVMKSDLADNYMECPHCGRGYVIDYTEDEIKALNKWSARQLLIQDALPNRNPYERELMRYAWSGMPMISCCVECHKETWGEEE